MHDYSCISTSRTRKQDIILCWSRTITLLTHVSWILRYDWMQQKWLYRVIKAVLPLASSRWSWQVIKVNTTNPNVTIFILSSPGKSILCITQKALRDASFKMWKDANKALHRLVLIKITDLIMIVIIGSAETRKRFLLLLLQVFLSRIFKSGKESSDYRRITENEQLWPLS